MKIKRFLSTKQSEGSTLLITRQAKQNNSVLSNIYQNCSELTLDRFIDCLLDNNFTRLIKTGTAKESDLLLAWENIFIEYCEKTNTTSFIHKFKLQKDLGINLNKLFIIETCISTLRLHYSQYLVSTLISFGYKYEFDYKDKEAFTSDLNRVELNKKSIELDVISLQKKLSDIQIEESKQPVMTIDYFDTWLTTLAKWKGLVVINANEITVTQFESMKKLYSSEMTKQSVRNGK
ncbi:MAG TPA: hypothetical protein VIK86_05620 [Candidatus Paceibacterota bacterium]